jgi:hypothetical protein
MTYALTPRGVTPLPDVLRTADQLRALEHDPCPGRPVYGHQWIAAADGVHCAHCPLVVTGDEPSTPAAPGGPK